MQNLISFLSLHSFRADTRLRDIFGADNHTIYSFFFFWLEGYGFSRLKVYGRSLVIKSFAGA
jgi:hypothetical protein